MPWLGENVKWYTAAMPRERASWDDYFMNIAREVSTRSTCDRKFVGAVIVRDKSILATGYNGSIRGLPHCDEEGHLMEDGHCVRTVHAEANAIVQAARNGARIDGAHHLRHGEPLLGVLSPHRQRRHQPHRVRRVLPRSAHLRVLPRAWASSWSTCRRRSRRRGGGRACEGGAMSALSIAVIQGGPSTEAEVSRASAKGVAAALQEAGHRVVRLEVDAFLSESLRTGGYDVVFPVVHGAVGEDGALQGLLEVLELPYVGSDVLASALAMHKRIARILFERAGLPVARGFSVPRGDAKPRRRGRARRSGRAWSSSRRPTARPSA